MSFPIQHPKLWNLLDAQPLKGYDCLITYSPFPQSLGITIGQATHNQKSNSDPWNCSYGLQAAGCQSNQIAEPGTQRPWQLWWCCPPQQRTRNVQTPGSLNPGSWIVSFSEQFSYQMGGSTNVERLCKLIGPQRSCLGTYTLRPLEIYQTGFLY